MILAGLNLVKTNHKKHIEKLRLGLENRVSKRDQKMMYGAQRISVNISCPFVFHNQLTLEISLYDLVRVLTATEISSHRLIVGVIISEISISPI